MFFFLANKTVCFFGVIGLVGVIFYVFSFSVVISFKFWWEKSKHLSHVTFICLKMLDVQTAKKDCLNKRP